MDVLEARSFELDVGVDSLVAELVVVDEGNLVDVLAVVHAPIVDVIDGPGGLDEVDFLVKGDVDGVFVGEPVAVGDVVEISLHAHVEAILACPAVGNFGRGADVGTVSRPLARLGGRGGGDESGDLHYLKKKLVIQILSRF